MTAMRIPGRPTGARPLGRGRVSAVVAIVDPGGLVGRVDAFLPRRWTTRRYRTIYDIERPELLVLGQATAPLVAAARLLHPHAAVFAVIGDHVPPRRLADLLHSGADACVREGALPVLASHLLAAHRRATPPAFTGLR